MQPAEAAKSLLNAVTWRLAFGDDAGVDALDAASMVHIQRPGLFYLSHGRDRCGHPIVITYKPDGPEDPDYSSSIANIVYQLEKASASMPPHLDEEKWVWIIDLRLFSYWNATPLWVTKQIIQIFGACVIHCHSFRLLRALHLQRVSMAEHYST